MKRDSVILTNSGTCKEWFLITQEMASQTVHLNKKFHKSNIILYTYRTQKFSEVRKEINLIKIRYRPYFCMVYDSINKQLMTGLEGNRQIYLP